MTDDGETEEAAAERDEDEGSAVADGEEPARDGVEGREPDRTEDREPDRSGATSGDGDDGDRPGATADRPDVEGASRQDAAVETASDDQPTDPATDDPSGGSTGEGRDRPAAGSGGGQDPSATGADVDHAEAGEREVSGSADDDEPAVGTDRPDADSPVSDHAGERAAGAESEHSADVGPTGGPSTERGPTPGSEPTGVDGSTEVGGSPGTDESTEVDEGNEGADAPGPAVAGDEPPGGALGEFDDRAAEADVPEDVRSYDRFQKVDRASYDRVNEFLRDRTYITAREWAIARLCADFRTATGVEMTKIGENLPHLVPFMTDTYSPQAVNQARSAFEDKVRMAGATFLYGAMSGFFTADELDDIMYEVTEVAKFLLEVEGVELTVDEELDAEDRISAVMREVRQASEELRYDEVACPHCGEAFQPAED